MLSVVVFSESARGSFRIGVRMTITGPNELSGPNDHVLLECMCIFSQFSEFRISAFRKCPSFQYVYFQSDLIFWKRACIELFWELTENTHRSVLANYVAKSGVLYWYSKKEGHGCCNGPNVKVECAIHIWRIPPHIVYTDVLSSMPLLYSGEVRVSAGSNSG